MRLAVFSAWGLTRYIREAESGRRPTDESAPELGPNRARTLPRRRLDYHELRVFHSNHDHQPVHKHTHILKT